MYSVIGIGLAIGLIAIGLIAIVIAGVRSITNGKQDFKKVGSFLVPFVVFGVAYGVTGSAGEAGIATMLFLMALMALLIAVTGLRSSFNF